MTLTHKALCEIGRRWLLRSHSAKGPGCRIALAEPPIGLHGGEIPDAIGWRTADYRLTTYVVEAKTSRSDFLADKAKLHRGDAAGVGDYRYYLCPEGVIDVEDLPAQWGLLWVRANGHIKHRVNPHATRTNLNVRAALDEMRFEHVNRRQETAILANALARVGDPQAALDEIRHFQRAFNRLAQQYDKQAEEIRELRLGRWRSELRSVFSSDSDNA